MTTPSTSPKLLNLNEDYPSKNLLKSLRNQSYDNFSRKKPRVTKLSLHDQIYS